MKKETFCQSCSMPVVSPLLLGTEKDGSKNQEYCKYCYQDGAFTSPQTTLTEMISQVVTQMETMHMDSETINSTISILPDLKRWQSAEL